ncbi:acid protease [Mollisia scopiformis]|uniref:Acid protease n=1 Tax=Mollisia scopiformis TaxID=149040 RepID=A0A132BA07_MOLSC|nr:acid protease [Mollisia scopiformis]KUJ09240.1 acid protease [Mollisia scopiformis]
MAKMLFSLIEVALLVAPSVAVLHERAYYASQGILEVPITGIPKNVSLSKRQVANPLINMFQGLEYLISFGIGTPPQNITLALDTGSSDTWVNPTCITGQRSDLCAGIAQYVPASSSSSKNLGNSMSLAYGIGRAQGTFYTDDVHLGGADIKAQQFGVASDTQSLDTGLLGIGFGVNFTTAYPNIIDQMAAQNITNSRAFSLNLAGVDSSSGAVVFGGIDTKKFYGKLGKQAIVPYKQSPDGFPRYWITMTSLSVTTPSKTTTTIFSGTAQPVFLDSGGTLSQLPATIVTAIVALFPGAKNVGSGQYTVPCSALQQQGFLDFGFANTTIRVPYHEFVWQADVDLCALGVMANAAGDPTYVLGDSFLRAAYVVYDQDNMNIHLANAASCGSNLVPIGKGLDAVPALTGDCPEPVAAVPKATSATSVSSRKPTSSMMPITTSKPSKTTTTRKGGTTSSKTVTTPAAGVGGDE